MTDLPTSCEVLIVGAGPTGLALGVRLCQLGVDCVIVERKQEQSSLSKAIGLHARSLEILDLLGARDDVEAHALRQDNVILYNEGDTVASLHYGDLDAAFPYVLGCSQATLEEDLAQRYHQLGGLLFHNLEVVALSQDHGRVEIMLNHLESGNEYQISADFVVAADGAFSAVRTLLNIHLQTQPEPESFVLADVEWDLSLDRDSAHVFLQERAMLLALPVPEGWRLVLREHTVLRQTDEENMAFELLQKATFQAFERQITRDRVTWMSRFTLQRAVAEQFRVNRVFLAGDAAHVYSPIGAQGLNAGLADASNLSWKLAQFLRAKAGPDLLDSYQQERWHVAEQQSAHVDTWSRLSNIKGRFFTAARDATLRMINGKPSMGRRILRRIAQLDVHYRGSPAVLTLSRVKSAIKGAPQSGDFLPVLPFFQKQQGKQLTTLNLLTSGQHQLLLYVGDGVGPAEVVAIFALIERVPVEFAGEVNVVLVHNGNLPDAMHDASDFDVIIASDVDNQWRRRLGEEGVYLLRPDGYLAFSGELAQAIRLLEWMHEYFLYDARA